MLEAALRRSRNATGRTVLFDENSTSNSSHLFEVTNEPLVLQLFGATGDQTVSIYSHVRGLEAPFLLDGVPLYVNESVNTAILSTAGVYRAVVTSGTRDGLTFTVHKQTVDAATLEIPQASGVQANLPNLFMSPEGAINPSNIWEIADKPWIFTVFGLQVGEYIETYVVYGQNETYKEELFLLAGVPQILTPLVTSIVLSKAGRYRFKLVGSLLGKTLVGNPTRASNGTGDGSGTVISILPGTGIDVDATNPASPIVALDSISQIALGLASTSVQPGDNISLLVNDVGYSTVSNHEGLSGLQGGIPGEHFHLTQLQHTTLTNIGALGTGFLVHTGPSSWEVRNVTGANSVTVATPDGVAGNPVITLVNDVVTPPSLSSYSADATGTRGWFRPALFESSGILSGCVLSVGPAGNQITIGSGTLGFTDYTVNPLQPTRVPMVFPGAVVTITGIATTPQTFIGIDSTGAVIQQPTRFTNTQRRSIAPIGIAIHTNLVSVNVTNEEGGLIRAGISQVHDLMEAIGPLNLEGNQYSANGANRRIDKSAGRWFKFGVKALTQPLDPNTITLASGVAITFRQRTQTGEIPVDVQDLDTTNYDVGGVVTDMSPANRFQVKRVYQFQSNLTRILYGQTLYSTLDEARAAIASQPFVTEANAAINGMLRGYIIVKDGCTNLSNTAECQFIDVAKFGSPATSGSGSIANTDQLAEGLVNLYYTDARVRTAAVASSIVDGDLLHAPDGNSVFDALALKADKATTITAGTGLTGGGDLSINRTIAIAATGVGPGSYGSATQSPTYTVNSLGQLTLAANVLITPAFSSITSKPTTLLGYGITDAALDSAVVHIAGTETITGAKTFTADTLVAKANAVIGIGVTATLNGGIANYAAAGVGDVGLFSEHAAGTLRLRPNGRLSSTGQVSVTTTQVRMDDHFVTIGAQSGGSTGGLRIEATGGARASFTNTGVRRYTIGNDTSSFTIRDESGGADRLTITSAGLATFANDLRVSGRLGIGGAVSTTSVVQNIGDISGATTSVGYMLNGTVQSGVTAAAIGYRSSPSIAAAAFTIASLQHFRVAPGTLGAGAAITNQYGLLIDNLTDATNNYGVYSQLSASGTSRWNFYAPGTAPNYMEGRLGLGTTTLTITGLRNSLDISGSTSCIGTSTDGVIQSDVTSIASGYSSGVGTAAAAFTLTNLRHYTATQGTIGAGSAVTNQIGYLAASTLTGATNNYGFRAQIAAAANRWNVYADGTAVNHMAGALLLGSTTDTGEQLQVTGDTVIKTGRLYGTALHNNASALTGTTNQYVGSGTYTPSGTGLTNVSALTPSAAQWTRVGNVVTVSGSVSVTPTAGAPTKTTFNLTLPIASNFTATNQVGGAGGRNLAAQVEAALVLADATNDQATIAFMATATGAATLYYSYTYVVL